MRLVAGHYEVSEGMVTSGERNDLRKVVIYLLKTRTAASNREIGEAVGGMSGFAVAMAYQRMVAEMGGDAKIGKEIRLLENALSRVKG